MVTDLSRKFASKDADFGMHCSGELRQSFRMRTTRRIGFRHGSVLAARAYKRPELAASKITFSGKALQSYFPDATRAGCNGRAPSNKSRRGRACLAGQPWALVRAHGGREGPKTDDLRAAGARSASQDAARGARG